MRVSVIGCLLITLITAWLGPLRAAFNTGDIRGQVHDPTGAVIPDARITVTSQETGERRVLGSDGEGRFAANQLKIGAYEIRAEALGFRTGVAPVAVRSGEFTAVSIRLEVGEITETVTVTDAASPLHTGKAQLQTSYGESLLADLPVNRNHLQFATLSPGVTPVSANNTFLSTAAYNTHGGRGRANNITLDYINANDIQTAGAAGLGSLSFAALKEVKLITHNFDAEFGRNASSQLQLISKSGTNELRGEAYEFLQNNRLNARDFFDRSGQPAVTRLNQFGYTVGGPVRRNRTHFFHAYEGFQRRGAGATRIAQVPSPAMLAEVRDPTSRALLKQYQLPAATQVGVSSGQVEQSASNLRQAFLLSFRGDHQLSDRDTLTARYGHSQLTSISTGNTFAGGANLTNFGIKTTDGPHNFGLTETRVFSAALVNEFRFAFGRSAPQFPLETTVPVGPRIMFQNLQVSHFGQWEGAPQGRVQNTFQYSNTLAWFRGAHNLKLGTDIYRYQANSYIDALQRPRFQFANWPDFADGRPTVYQQNFGSSMRGHRMTNHAYFLQNDWKIHRDLTLNLGVRTEVAGGVREVNGLISNLDLHCREPLGAAGPGPLGCFSVGRPTHDTNLNFGPRFGLAWDLDGGATVIRGGYGITYDFLYLNPIVNGRFLPPFIVTATLTGAESFTGENSFARLVAGTALIQQQGQAASGRLDPTLLNYGSVNPAIDRNLRNPQVQQWNLSLERRLGSSIRLRAGYVGSKANYLQRSHQLNLVHDVRAAPAASLADETARLADFAAVNRDRSGGATRLSNRLDPRFNEVVLLDSSANSNYHGFQLTAEKTFDRGYQLRLAYTVSKSIDDVSDALNVLVNDDSGQQNPRDNRDNRAVSQFDVPQRLVITHYWEPPWLRAFRHPVARVLAQGWGFSGISVFQAGFPATFDSGTRRGIFPLSLTGGANVVRVNAGGSVDFQPAPAGRAGAPGGLNNDAVQPISAYAAQLGLSQPLIGNFGALGRNAVRLNGMVNFDWAVYKVTSLTENVRLQLRGEFYNLFNNTSFSGVQLNITNPAFGQYTRTENNQRFVQVGARVIF
jgi:hypothetical protein